MKETPGQVIRRIRKLAKPHGLQLIVDNPYGAARLSRGEHGTEVAVYWAAPGFEDRRVQTKLQALNILRGTVAVTPAKGKKNKAKSK